jgi:hypothetical protein
MRSKIQCDGESYKIFESWKELNRTKVKTCIQVHISDKLKRWKAAKERVQSPARCFPPSSPCFGRRVNATPGAGGRVQCSQMKNSLRLDRFADAQLLSARNTNTPTRARAQRPVAGNNGNTRIRVLGGKQHSPATTPMSQWAMAKDGNGDPRPDTRWVFSPLGYQYGVKLVLMGT